MPSLGRQFDAQRRDGLLQRLPASLRQTMSPEQQQAIASVMAGDGGTRPPINLRLSIPLPGMPVFLTIIGGRERRSRQRRTSERRHHPIRTLGNAVFMLLGLAGFYGVSLTAVLLSTAVFEF